MYRFIFGLCAIGAVTASLDIFPRGSVPQLDGRIVGGENAEISQYPHQISMRYNGRHRCGGSVYSTNVIVSAAHCVFNITTTNLTIVAGSTFLNEGGQELPVSSIIIHENYKTSNNDYDVALLILNGHLQLNSNVQPIGLAKVRPADGSDVIVTGWGVLKSGSNEIPNHLQQVKVNVLEQKSCRSTYSLLLTNRMICANVQGGGKDACQGDSGGPLISADSRELVGIVSWGFGCASRIFPGVYASVAELHDWITSQADINGAEPFIDFL